MKATAYGVAVRMQGRWLLPMLALAMLVGLGPCSDPFEGM